MDSLSKIDALGPALREIPASQLPQSGPDPLDFRIVFKNALTEVNALDTHANRMVEDLASGKTNDVSAVMMAVQKSNLSFNLLMQIRNKVIEAYDEVMRMRM